MLLEVKNLRKDFTRGKLFSAVDNVIFSLEQGDFACVMGRSGSGKTTLLNMIAGVLTPTNGKIMIDGTLVHALTDQQLALFRNRTIGYIPQGASLLANLTALENICLPFYLHYKENQAAFNQLNCQDKAFELLEHAGIDYLKDMYPAQLSGGEMRRVAVVRSLICEPKLIVADEPTNDLDEETAMEIMQLLSKINQQGSTLLVVTHDEDVARFAKRKFKMASGKLEELVE